MENSNFYNIFKSHRTTLRDKDIEMAYVNRKYLIKPFNIFNVWSYCFLLLSTINVIRLILIYFEVMELNNEIYFLCVDAIMIVNGKLLYLAGKKLPKSHNIFGCLGIIIALLYIIEAYLVVADPIYVFIK